MDLDSGAGLLHRLTSYGPDREWTCPWTIRASATT